jgi:hypothetical protein
MSRRSPKGRSCVIAVSPQMDSLTIFSETAAWKLMFEEPGPNRARVPRKSATFPRERRVLESFLNSEVGGDSAALG